VMDNCPGGYNDFLKCTLFTKNWTFSKTSCFFQNLPYPDPLVRGMDPRIRIHTKRSWIRITAFNKNLSSLIYMHTLHNFTNAWASQVSMRVCTRRPSLDAGIMCIWTRRLLLVAGNWEAIKNAACGHHFLKKYKNCCTLNFCSHVQSIMPHFAG
jgi:hypothetical protein